MREPSELQKQQYERFTEILNTGKQRYIEAKGTHKGYRAGLKGQDYLTDEERQEALSLVRQLFQVREKSGNLTATPLLKEGIEADS
ncbi:MAG: hypothetical protein N4J56_006149 [Chroococcidiopsis sp. SAG 2025]|uniref:hypothetical protein n=1 Tax=Chroococcidiopsis sp. SAG 2025 TaxID=171389 RepID=UPI0029372CDA|nr:hypothetical protein [Chroococcidiopsis sp. SAG 2025]MDV2996495.1 hypothetical protein [Chroococcidiopsis sp. SAG 2025]